MTDPTLPKKRRRRPPAAEIEPDTLIWCPWCEVEHPASAFNKESRRFSGLSGICREAQAEKRQLPQEQVRNQVRNQRRWADPDYRARSLEGARQRRLVVGTADLKRARARLQEIVQDWKQRGCIDCGYRVPPSWRRRLELQDFNDRLKLALGCADCGWNQWARGLDWDHARGKKLYGIATLINDRWPVEVLISEMAKCDVVCANCHRVRTCERRLRDAEPSDPRN